LIEQLVDKGATTAEEIHRSVAETPVSVLEEVGLLGKETSAEVKRLQDTSMGALYDLIRDVNHKVSKLATELLEQRVLDRRDDEGAEDVSDDS